MFLVLMYLYVNCCLLHILQCDDHSRDETDHEENGAAPDSMGGKPSSQKGASSMTGKLVMGLMVWELRTAGTYTIIDIQWLCTIHASASGV